MLGIFKRLRYLEQAFAIHARDHEWQALEKRTTALEKLELERLRERALKEKDPTGEEPSDGGNYV